MAEANVPYTFTNGVGNTIDATEVNANFTELEGSVNDVDKDQLNSDLADKLGVSSTATVRRGKCIIATEESTTSTSYTTLTTPDRVQNVVLPTDGLLFVAYRSLAKVTGGGTGVAAIFLGSNQVKNPINDNVPVVQVTGSIGAYYGPLFSYGGGLARSASSSADSSYVTTGQTIGPYAVAPADDSGVCVIEAAAGTYTVSVQFKTSAGTLYAKDRKLWVWTQAF